MKTRTVSALSVTLLLILVISSPRPVQAQDSDIVARILAFTNSARVANGLPPYSLNSLLTLSAQRHSEYQASIQQFTHVGADGSRTLQRVLAVGYPAIRANENIYAGTSRPEDVANWWLTADEAHRNNMLHPVLREVGIGAAQDVNGVTYYTMDISAQPNVLPIFINNDAYSTTSPNVTLTLTNELVFSGGSGQIGQASQVMISNSPDFSGASQQPWAQMVNWSLDASSTGFKTVYVRFIDGAGRTADSQDSITFDGITDGSAPQPAVVQTVLPTGSVPQPTNTPFILTVPQVQPANLSTATAVITDVLPAATPAAVAENNSETLFAVRSNYDESAVETSTPTWFGMPAQLLRIVMVSLLALAIGAVGLGTLIMVRARRIARLVEQEAEDDSDG